MAITVHHCRATIASHMDMCCNIRLFQNLTMAHQAQKRSGWCLSKRAGRPPKFSDQSQTLLRCLSLGIAAVMSSCALQATRLARIANPRSRSTTGPAPRSSYSCSRHVLVAWVSICTLLTSSCYLTLTGTPRWISRQGLQSLSPRLTSSPSAPHSWRDFG